MPLRRRLLPIPVLLIVAGTIGACGGSENEPAVWYGRVTSKTELQYCLTPDRGTRFRCVDAERARGGPIEVGQCVEAVFPPSPDGSIRVVDDAECAAGDLGS